MNKYLFIDDNIHFLELIKDLCSVNKIISEIVTFEDAFEALSYISKNHQDINAVFTDYHMEKAGTSGKIVAEKCHEKLIPVYMVTGDLDVNLPAPVIHLPKVNSLKAIVEIIKNEEGMLANRNKLLKEEA